MSFMNLFQKVRLPTKQVFKVVSKSGLNCELFDECACMFDNMPQLGLIVS